METTRENHDYETKAKSFEAEAQVFIADAKIYSSEVKKHVAIAETFAAHGQTNMAQIYKNKAKLSKLNATIASISADIKTCHANDQRFEAQLKENNTQNETDKAKRVKLNKDRGLNCGCEATCYQLIAQVLDSRAKRNSVQCQLYEAYAKTFESKDQTKVSQNRSYAVQHMEYATMDRICAAKSRKNAMYAWFRPDNG
jgi:hypothetical protein